MNPSRLGDCSEEAATRLFKLAIAQGKAGRLLSHLFDGHGARVVDTDDGPMIEVISADTVRLAVSLAGTTAEIHDMRPIGDLPDDWVAVGYIDEEGVARRFDDA